MSIIVNLPALPNNQSSHFSKGITYINKEDNLLQQRRDSFDLCIAAVDEKYNRRRKLNAMDNLLALVKKYAYLTS